MVKNKIINMDEKLFKKNKNSLIEDMVKELSKNKGCSWQILTSGKSIIIGVAHNGKVEVFSSYKYVKECGDDE